VAAPLIHYTFGAVVGALYGMYADGLRGHRAAAGIRSRYRAVAYRRRDRDAAARPVGAYDPSAPRNAPPVICGAPRVWVDSGGRTALRTRAHGKWERSVDDVDGRAAQLMTIPAVPFFRRCIADLTVFDADLPYFAMCLHFGR